MTLIPVESLRSELKRARIRRTDTREEFEVQFNPETLQVVHEAEWNASTGSTAAPAPVLEYIRPKPRLLQLALTLDAGEGKRDVAADVARLTSWMLPSEESRRQNSKQPPILTLEWNGPSRFHCYLEKVDATYQLFRRDGTPVRAKVTVTLKEAPLGLRPTNPSSGGEPGHRRHTVTAGETLHSIAQREYGDPRLWRGLATVNGVTDPLRVAPGHVLHVLPRDRVAALS